MRLVAPRGETPGVAGARFATPLGDMSADEFRHCGRAVVGWIADYFERVEQLPVLAGRTSRTW